VKAAAEERGLPVLQPSRLGKSAREEVAPLGAELLVCVAYGKIFGPKFLALFPGGGINVHPSLLPRHRGPSPVTWTILSGDSEGGISVQRLAREMDRGDILAQERLPLRPEETTGSLTETVAERGAPLLADTVDRIASERVTDVPQLEERATYSRIVSKDDGWLDFSEEARVLERKVRAYNPWPGAASTWDGTRLTFHRAEVLPGSGAEPGTVLRVDKAHGVLIQTGLGILAVQELQLQGKKSLHWKQFINGHQDLIGSVLGR
jgi:methionyl-tRNA formyltransferase